jgi:hypothetical protein
MLMSGIFWAFVIGNLVKVVSHVNRVKEQYKIRMAEANDMLSEFSRDIPDSDKDNFSVGDPEAVSTRIRHFITEQHIKANRKMRKRNASTLEEIFPSLKLLSPELRRLARLQLMRRYLEIVPYLSSEYLSPEAQSNLAMKCIFMEFARGETYRKHPTFGRGLMIMKKGLCMASRRGSGWIETYNIDTAIGLDEILVEEDFLGRYQPTYHFVMYSLVIFIPRDAIFEVLHENKRAWSDCARWRYLMTCLVKWSRDERATLC